MGCKILDLLPIRQEVKNVIIAEKENYDFLGDEKYKEIYKDIFHTKEDTFDIFSKHKINIYKNHSEFCRFIENAIVPSTQKYNDGRYKLLKHNLPLANLSDIRNLAESLKMVIIPVEHSNKTIMFGNDLKLSAMYDIVSANNDNLYMVCPIDYYNSYCHIKNPDKPLLYIPEEFKAQFETFNSMLPILSHLLLKVDEHDESINKLNMDVKALCHRVDILENISKERREEEVRKSNIIQFQYKDLDPMIFTIDGLNECRIHMLWGADLPDILLENKNLKVFKENSKLYPNQFFEYVYPNLDYVDKNLEISDKIAKFKVRFQDNFINEFRKGYWDYHVIDKIFDFENSKITSDYFKNIAVDRDCVTVYSNSPYEKNMYLHSSNSMYDSIINMINSQIRLFDEFRRSL
jgi:hypothetical protein